MPKLQTNRFCQSARATGLLLACAISCAATAFAEPLEYELANVIIVKASSSMPTETSTQFLQTFASTAVRLKGEKFTAHVGAAVKARPDLADKIVISALSICRLDMHLTDAQLSCETIARIIRAAVSAAPAAAPAIVKAALKSEPYARDCIVAAAIARAPEEETEIREAAREDVTMSIFPWEGAGTINPANLVGPSNVNSPEQPPGP
ncbi:MAG: hypothetical protein QOI04_1145 [Verrucomicrobiota bacterium]|jgi:hypothetical protein